MHLVTRLYGSVEPVLINPDQTLFISKVDVRVFAHSRSLHFNPSADVAINHDRNLNSINGGGVSALWIE